MAGKHSLVLLCVLLVALASFSAAKPSPFNLKKTFNKVKDKFNQYVTPTLNCLKKAGASDAAMGYLKECGQTKYFGKTAMFSCAATTYAPSDVKDMLKQSAGCFSSG